MTFKEELTKKADEYTLITLVSKNVEDIKTQMEQEYHLRRFVLRLIDPILPCSPGRPEEGRLSLVIPKGTSLSAYLHRYIAEFKKLGFELGKNMTTKQNFTSNGLEYKITLTW